MTTTLESYDVIGAEVHRKAMDQIAHEMGITLVRTSGSPVVTEAKDLSCSVLDEKLEQVGFSSFIAPHIATAPLGVEAVLRNYPIEDIAPGDGFLVNDPHSAGALHQGDLGVVMPYFHDGSLVAWGYVNEHVLDIGGSSVSGFAPTARDVFSEALRFPGVRFLRDGEILREWVLFIGRNVRVPMVMNDLRGMVAALNAGQRRLTRTIERFGLDAHREYCEINKALSEKMVRARIAALPSGTYSAEDWVEFDGHGTPELYRIGCDLIIDGDEMTLRFSGVAQVDAPINGAPPAVKGMALTALQTVFLHDVPPNAGLWGPITFDYGPQGTVVNSVPPAPVSYSHVETGLRVEKVTRAVLTQAIGLSSDEAVRNRMASQPSEGIVMVTLTGIDRRSGQPAVIFPISPTVGIGGPAQTTSDGLDTYSNAANLGSIMTSVEVEELSGPLMILWRYIVPSSGGAGESRGGQGMSSAFAIIGADQLSGTASNTVVEVPPRGAGGGRAGAATHFHIVSDTDVQRLLVEGVLPTPENLGGTIVETASKTTVQVREGDVFVIVNGGGGGLGDPLLRDPGLVAKDVDDGYVGAEVAKALYGVVLAADGAADGDASASERRAVRESRLGHAPTRELRPDDQLEVGIAIQLRDDRWSCAYCAGDLGSADADFRAACISKTEPVAEAHQRFGMQIRARTAAPNVMMTEHFCPECASAIHTDVGVEGQSLPPGPRLAHVAEVTA